LRCLITVIPAFRFQIDPGLDIRSVFEARWCSSPGSIAG
jgi:hypothetical protein